MFSLTLAAREAEIVLFFFIIPIRFLLKCSNSMKTLSTPKWRGKPSSPEPNYSPPSTPQNISEEEASEAARSASPFHAGNPDLSLCGIFQNLAVRDTPYMRQRVRNLDICYVWSLD